MLNPVLAQGPFEAKRVDAHHAVIYDSAGLIVLKTPGREDAWEIALTVAETLNNAITNY